MLIKLKESHLLSAAQFLTILFPFATLMERTPPDIIGSMIATLFLLRSMIWRKWDFLQESWVKAGIVFWIYMTASAIWAYTPLQALSQGMIWGRFLFFGIAVAYWVMDDPKMHHRLFYGFLLTIAVLGVDILYQCYNGVDIIGTPKVDDRLTGPYDAPRAGSGILYLIFPLLSYSIASEKRWTIKLPFILLSTLGIISILLTGDRSPAVLLLLTLALLFLLFMRSRQILTMVALICIITAAFSLQIIGHNYVKERQLHSTINLINNFWESSYGLLMLDTIPVIKHHFLFGVGAGNFRIYLCQMNNMQYFNEGCPIHPHNQYLDILASGGIVGLAIYLALIATLVWKFYHHFSIWRKDPIAIGLVTGFLVRAFPIIFATAYTRSYAGFTFWLLVGWAINRIDNAKRLHPDKIT